MDHHPTYEVLEEVGRSPLTQVVRAFHMKLRRQVAIKQLKNPPPAPRALEATAYWRSAQFQAGVKHDHLVLIHDLDAERGWVVREWMAGSLADWPAAASLPPDQVESLLRQALTALGHLHERRVLHGTIKPANLLVDERGRVKLSDPLGVSWEEEVPRPAVAKYLAPELLNAEFGEVGPAADLYCLGFTALELLVGPAFDGLFKGIGGGAAGGQTAWLRWHSSADEQLPPVAELVPGTPPTLARVLDRMLQKPVAKRYPDAAAVQRDLTGGALVAVAVPKPVSKEAVRAGGPGVVAVGGEVPTPANPVRKPLAVPQGKPQPAGEPGKGKAIKETLNRKPVLVGLLALIIVPTLAFLFWPGEAPAETARVTIRTQPAGAVISLDGKPAEGGQFDLRPGKYRLKLALAGHEAVEDEIVVQGTEKQAWQYQLRPRQADVEALVAGVLKKADAEAARKLEESLKAARAEEQKEAVRLLQVAHAKAEEEKILAVDGARMKERARADGILKTATAAEVEANKRLLEAVAAARKEEQAIAAAGLREVKKELDKYQAFVKEEWKRLEDRHAAELVNIKNAHEEFEAHVTIWNYTDRDVTYEIRWRMWDGTWTKPEKSLLARVKDGTKYFHSHRKIGAILFFVKINTALEGAPDWLEYRVSHNQHPTAEKIIHHEAGRQYHFSIDMEKKKMFMYSK